MTKSLANYWWLIVLKGIVGILFGLIAITYPGKTILITTTIIGLFILIDGIIISIASLFTIGKNKDWWVLLFQGIITVLFGAAIFAWTEITIAILFFLLAVWILFIGILLIVTAVITRKENFGGWTLIASGILALIFGIFLLSNPVTSIITLTVLAGLFMIVSGVLGIGFGLDLRSQRKK